MGRRITLFFPIIFVAAGALLLLIAGDDIEFAQESDTFIMKQWQFVVLGVLFNALLVISYRWFYQKIVSRSLFWLHFICTFAGMAIFLYLILPFNDGENLDDMLAGLTWLFTSAFLMLIGLISFISLVIKRMRRGREAAIDEQTVS